MKIENCKLKIARNVRGGSDNFQFSFFNFHFSISRCLNGKPEHENY